MKDIQQHGIPTVWRGVEYRSRLEARWAAFFHRIGWAHTYEPFDGNYYIPDFLIHGTTPFLVEVKPAMTRDDYLNAMPKIADGLPRFAGPVLVVGTTPLLDSVCGDWPLLGYVLWQEDGDEWVCSQASLAEIGSSAERLTVMYRHSDQRTFPAAGCEQCTSVLTVQHVRESWSSACNDVKWCS